MDTKCEGFTCYWRIENAVLFNKDSDFILESPIFRASTIESCFCLEIEDFDAEYLAIYLSKVCKPRTFCTLHRAIIRLNYSIFLLTKSGWITVTEKTRHSFKTDEPGWGEDKLVSFKNLEEQKFTYLPSGCLTIMFHMWKDVTWNGSAQCLIVSRLLDKNKISHLPLKTYYKLKPSDLLYFSSSYEIKTHSSHTRTTQTDVYQDGCALKNQDDILKFFSDKKIGFVTLKTSEKDFMVHKAVLCASSPVFKAMLEQEMLEKVKNIVNIDDIDGGTMKLLLNFLHLETLEDLNWDKGMLLYYAADKYQLELLKNSCALNLAKQFSDQTICDGFILADLHRDNQLKQSALNYFIQNSKSILRSNEWKSFLQNNTELAAEILQDSADG